MAVEQRTLHSACTSVLFSCLKCPAKALRSLVTVFIETRWESLLGDERVEGRCGLPWGG